MNPSQDIIRELEFKRRALNERLMNAKDVAEANGIERELWALRAAIRYHKGVITKATRRHSGSSQAAPAIQNSGESSGTNFSG